MSLDGRLSSSFLNSCNISSGANSTSSSGLFTAHDLSKNPLQLQYNIDPFSEDSPNQVLKETGFAGLEWGEELSAVNSESNCFGIRRAAANNSNGLAFSIPTDPNESILQHDEAFGLEFASPMPYSSVSNSAPALKLAPGLSNYSKSDSGFHDNSSYSEFTAPTVGGFEPGRYGFNEPVNNNERTFSSSSNSSNTSFISESSFNNLVKNAQEAGFRDSGGIFSASTPYRGGGAAGGDNFGGFLGNSIWSPTSGYGQQQQQQQQPQHNANLAILTGLSAKQTLQCLQYLQEILEECKDAGNSARIAQTCALMQWLQQHLLTELAPPSPSSSISNTSPPANESMDRAAKLHRDVAGITDATFTWSGQLPPRIHRNPTYSCKVFLGGVPWDITETSLISAFKPFGNVKIEWPGKDGVPPQPKGYAYVIFEHEKQVKLLLQNCTHDYSSSRAGNWYYKISSRRMRGKDVQVIPWALSDSNYVKCQATKLDAKKTIFVGALHGMLNAEGVATIMNDLFGGVVYAGIDTDRHKYPIGSGRVTFNNHRSYMKAVSAAFVEIKTAKFGKVVQVDPYLEDATCSICNLQQGPYFCRDLSCFRYYCRTCYQLQHTSEMNRAHRPLMRNASKPQGTTGSVTTASFYSNGNSGSGGNNSASNNGSPSSSFTGFQRRYEPTGSRFPHVMR